VVDEGVELPVLATRVYFNWEVAQQLLVIFAPGERRVEHARVDAHDDRAEAGVEETRGQLAGVTAPEWKATTLARGRESALAVGADVFEKQISEGDLLCSSQLGRGKRSAEPS